MQPFRSQQQTAMLNPMVTAPQVSILFEICQTIVSIAQLIKVSIPYKKVQPSLAANKAYQEIENQAFLKFTTVSPMPDVQEDARNILEEFIVESNAKVVSKTKPKKPKTSRASKSKTATKAKAKRTNSKQKNPPANKKTKAKASKPKTKVTKTKAAKPMKTKQTTGSNRNAKSGENCVSNNIRKQRKWSKLSKNWARFYGPLLYPETRKELEAINARRELELKTYNEQKHDQSCIHCEFMHLLKFDTKHFKFYTKPGNYLNERFCIDCGIAMVNAPKVKGLFGYGCNDDMLGWQLDDDDVQKRSMMCETVLCVNCHTARMAKLSSRRSRE